MTQPVDQQGIEAAARLLGFDLPEACRDGVEQNLALLRAHFAILESMPAENGVES